MEVHVKKQIFNPVLPLDEYVPDGEPHVFGDRVYLYGSHDSHSGKRFCEKDYTVYSAPVNDLSDWICHGVSYKKSQDPRSRPGKSVDYYAPDCVRGNDGRYYLYYVAMGPNVRNFGPISVAVSDKPEGPFEYHGDIRYTDGTPVLRFANNDPAVLNDDGRIWLYYGWGLGRDFRSKSLSPLYNYVLSKILERPVSEIKATKPGILSCAVVELESDMFTVKGNPKAVLDSKTTAVKSDELYRHAFYEAPSIRKFDNLYYLVYSSGENSELAYATSKYPDRGFRYRGVIISNSDLGYQGNRQPKAAGGTIHGGIEVIDGKYYIFYHRCTNNTNFSRQACAERIEIKPEGSILQVEMTTQGLNGKPLAAKGRWPAVICCNLFDARTRTVERNRHGKSRPNITWDGENNVITAIGNGTTIGYKYFDFKTVTELRLTLRGGGGTLNISTSLEGKNLQRIKTETSAQWKTYICPLAIKDGTYPLYFTYIGRKKLDILCFEII